MSSSSASTMPAHNDRPATADVKSRQAIARLSQFRLTESTQRMGTALVLVGAVAVALCIWINPRLTWASVLLASFLTISMALSGLLFIAFQYLTGAGWSVVLRRIHESLASLLLPGLVGIATVMLLYPQLYLWIGDAEVQNSLTGFKGFWLDHNGWLLRAVVYAAIWMLFAVAMRWHSRRQDRDGRISHTRWNVALSAMFCVLFALSYWLASVDWLMSLEPMWYSTMYGVYHFSGLVTGGLAGVIVMTVCLRDYGPLRGIVRDDHLHDLGKLLLAFTTFWAYIWFCQYMLIWYANIPEETVHFVRRTRGLWMPLFYLNLAMNWIIPFLALLPRAGKRDGSFLIKVAVVVLLGRWLDLYLLIVPTVSPSTPLAGIAPIGIALGMVGVWILVIGKSLSRHTLIPLNDPYLEESLHHHV